MRIRSKWRENQTVDLEEQATALAYICWQIALDKAKQLHVDDFIYDNDEQRTGIIREYLCFLVHIADRLTHASMNAEQRQQFVTELANGVTRHYQRNLEDVYGRGQDFRAAFIETLNERIVEYSEYRFSENEPGYQMIRGLGRHTQDLMGEDQTNRWVIDQIMDIDAPDAVLALKRNLDNLFGSATAMQGMQPPD